MKHMHVLVLMLMVGLFVAAVMIVVKLAPSPRTRLPDIVKVPGFTEFQKIAALTPARPNRLKSSAPITGGISTTRSAPIIRPGCGM